MMWALSTMGDMPKPIAPLRPTRDARNLEIAVQRDFRGGRHEKRIKLGKPAFPTPTKEEIIKLERARRGANPACLHFGVEKEVCKYVYPNHFFCGHCNDYIDAMIHSMNKKAIKSDSRSFICQRGHTKFIMPATLREHKL
jgi:hypothetical protein